MILLIDNYDSFTYNIYQYLMEDGQKVTVKRNDTVTIEEIQQLNPSHIIISPGPGRPEDAGISMEVISRFSGVIPVLGICLGMQAIATVFGGRTIYAKELFHGKNSDVSHKNSGVFSGLKNPFSATRYHSLAVERETLPKELTITASTDDGEIMGLKHRYYSIEGVQFHPESAGSEEGRQLLRNFILNSSEQKKVKEAINTLSQRGTVSRNEAVSIMEEIISSGASNSQIAALLTALNFNIPSSDILTGFAAALRENKRPVSPPHGGNLLDTCGTGGDGLNTFNISTVSAFVTAGAGVPVAKHGNRSVTSRCGSADLLEMLGVKIHLSSEEMVKVFNETGITFIFAPAAHRALKNVGLIRQELGVPTIFNLLGPLTNPFNANRQIVGVYRQDVAENIAMSMKNLGISRGMVVHGSDGMDEITLTGKSNITEIRDGWIKCYTFDPEEAGLNLCSLKDIKGGDIKENCDIALSVLNGATGPCREIVLLNAAASIYIGGEAESIEDGLIKAAESIDSGAAYEKLEKLIEATNG